MNSSQSIDKRSTEGQGKLYQSVLDTIGNTPCSLINNLDTGNSSIYVKSEFFTEPGITIITSLLFLSRHFDKGGLENMWPIHLFHIEHALNTKLFMDMPRTHFGGSNLLDPRTLNLKLENKHMLPDVSDHGQLQRLQAVLHPHPPKLKVLVCHI